MRYFTILVIGLISVFLACRHTPHTSAKPAAFEALPADFRDFYQKFHSDSAYQMAHIQWPLRGETAVQYDTIAPERRLATWAPEQWALQHRVDLSTGEFKGEWEVMGEDFVIERIKYAAANYGVERHFMKRDDGEWELMYYADMQDMGR